MIKKKQHEKLDDTNIRHVISLIGQEKPITKKEACSILNISYNTTRLTKIITDFKTRSEFKKVRKAQNKGKAATTQEISQIAQNYLEGDNISSIAKGLFRSSGFVKAVINRIGIPRKPLGAEKNTVAFLPETCVAESFQKGERVWSAVYNAPALIDKEIEGNYTEVYGGKAYRMYIFEQIKDTENSLFKHIDKGGFYATSIAYDIGSLKHLEELKINWSYI